MTELEIAIAATLRDDAQEAAMSTNTHQEQRELEARLDDLDSRRTRNRWLVGLVAVAATMLLIVGVGSVLTSRQQHGGQVVTRPTPTLHEDPYFVPAFTLALPSWLVENSVEPHENATYSWWSHCAAPATCGDFSVSRFDNLALGSTSTSLTAAGFLQHLRALQTAGALTISATSPTTVDGRAATEVRAWSTAGKPLALGCAANSCQDVPADSVMRYVVIDMGAGQNPVVMFTQASKANPDGERWLQQMDAAVSTMTFR